MRYKVVTALGLAGMLALCVISASAHVLTSATVTGDCCQYSITLAGTSINPGETVTLSYSFTLTQAGGSPMTIAAVDLPATADSGGNFSVTFTFPWLPSGCVLQAFTLSNGTATMVTEAGEISSTGITFPVNSFSCVPPSGKTFSIGPSSMEGNLFIHPGDWISGGYSFKFVTNTHPATAYTVTATVTVPVTCPQGGGAGGNIVVDLGTVVYNVPGGNTNWLPTGDANSILSWQGAALAPDLCGGNVMNNQHGAIFTTTVSQNPPAGLVNWRFKYRDPAAKGKGNVNCTDASNPRRNDAATCGASWSQTVRDP